MALIVEQRGPSEEKMEFSGSSEEDVAYAKTFWQSIQLLPPIESRLVSSDIRQRLKVAPQGGQPTNITFPEREQAHKLTTFLAKAQAETQAEEFRRLRELGQKRQDNITLLHKHRQQRQEMEKISNKQRPKKTEMSMGPPGSDEEEMEDAAEALKDLDKFDREKFGTVESVDSDSD